jgi:hypothetical protein
MSYPVDPPIGDVKCERVDERPASSRTRPSSWKRLAQVPGEIASAEGGSESSLGKP